MFSTHDMGDSFGEFRVDRAAVVSLGRPTQ